MKNKMQYLGNSSLLHLPKSAFLASSTIPVEMVLRCYDWAVWMRDERRCVISGFNSRLEKDVLKLLITGTQPIILVLAREMYHRIPPELQQLLNAGRLLIISTSSSPRQSKATAFARNKYICEQADEILLVGADAKSSLYPLRTSYAEKLIRI